MQCTGCTDYKLASSHTSDHFIISYGNEQNTILTIENHFFKENLQYTSNLIPSKADEVAIVVDDNIHHLIQLYGHGKYNNDWLALDIVASTFFMATRWEETVVPERDLHGRFDENHASSVRFNFLDRPIINEYACLLKDILSSKGIHIISHNPNAQIKITFDIDYLYKWKSWSSLFGNLYRKGPTLEDKIFYVKNFIVSKILRQRHRDLFFSFDTLLEQLQKNNLQAIFYFMVAKMRPLYDHNDYDIDDPLVKRYMVKIIEKGHTLALHSSYDAILSTQQLITERKKLEEASGQKIENIRPHYVRILPTESLRNIAKSGFLYESSMIYPRNFGFRCGTTQAIPFFDLSTKTTTNLIMIPTIAMSSIGVDQNLEYQYSAIKQLIKTMKTYGGEAQIIWHNSDLDTSSKRDFFIKV
ncbi:MAG TPA: hypothetical protein PKD85_18745, partial [Saprospiraceae bacterium]|nr:hypothetical protein [Saprospiraceae bacterium]